MYCIRIFLCVTSLLVTTGLHAQDTLHITLQQAEQQFLERNLALMAEQYNISIAQAEVIQAKLYNNPSISFGGSIYNPDLRKFADIGNRTGQYTVGIAQLITLAGKRNKQITLAGTEAAMAESRFFELLRTLGYTLRSNFHKARYLQSSIRAFDVQVRTLEQLASTYRDLQSKGLVTPKDAIRIRSLLYSLKAEQTTLQNEFNDVEGELQLLLQDNRNRYIPDAQNLPITPVKSVALQSLLDTAFANRRDLRLAQQGQQYSEADYSLQKALAVPDMTIGAMFDKRSDYIENASLLNIAFDLPLFNRNQGNIRAARLRIAQSKALLELQSATVENEVRTAYAKAVNADNMLCSVDPGFREEFEQLLQSVTEHFIKKNISLLEFTDFCESYKENLLQLNQVHNERMQAIEQLNFALGKNLFNNK
ncbi:TolC family protein [Chitinophaga sp. XS-30]|uniref:TolC family protein n=1 Tax=Chitinophaga sp. XS-30 TaxID=2604421 RepID=UPI0011DD2811|nr:TolC family protein [Chitinophaga sp. XS-30]QEH43037.1 TolC family protein [Chitinophaga sp. XS-30]